MTEVERIADQLRRSHEGPAWHGPSLLEILDGVDAARAAARPPIGSHSIWEIVLHINTWQDVVRRRVEGEEVIDVPEGRNWPAVAESDESAWRSALDGLEAGHRRLREAIGRLTADCLSEIVPGRQGYTVYTVLHGVVQHNLYHAGQIALLRKAAIG